MNAKRHPHKLSDGDQKPDPTKANEGGDTGPLSTSGPQFAEPAPTPDPDKFTVKHGSDAAAYKILDSQKGRIPPRSFPVVTGQDEPRLTLAQTLGSKGQEIVSETQRAGRIVFHAVGDTGNTKGPRDQNEVADKMIADFEGEDPRNVPSFFYHLGDVVYSFGETEYYYDQFYDPYRDYPAPIFAIPGNHDGMVAPNSSSVTLQAFLENFCAVGAPPHRTPEAGGLVRTAQVQPGVYFTLEAPFIRILGLYSNCLEDPGIISSQKGKYPELSDAQLVFLKTALQRVSDEKYSGALLIAAHHPPYGAVTRSKSEITWRHGGSPDMLAEIDAACAAAGVWPHAVLSGHAHNYQRFTRSKDGRETPFIVAGNGGHAVARLTHRGMPALRAPVSQPTLSDGTDSIVLENYDDQEFGYLRLIADDSQLRIEYHPASDGPDAKTADDWATVDLKTRKIVHFQPT
jgi:hypothetical protein